MDMIRHFYRLVICCLGVLSKCRDKSFHQGHLQYGAAYDIVALEGGEARGVDGVDLLQLFVQFLGRHSAVFEDGVHVEGWHDFICTQTSDGVIDDFLSIAHSINGSMEYIDMLQGVQSTILAFAIDIKEQLFGAKHLNHVGAG